MSSRTGIVSIAFGILIISCLLLMCVPNTLLINTTTQSTDHRIDLIKALKSLLYLLGNSTTEVSYEVSSYPIVVESTSRLTVKPKLLLLWYLSADNDIDEALFIGPYSNANQSQWIHSVWLNGDAFLLNHIIAAILTKHPSNIEILILRDAYNDKERGAINGIPIDPVPLSIIANSLETELVKLYRVDTATGCLEEIQTDFTGNEGNMGKANMLHEFLDYALNHYDPSEYYFVLLMTDHGRAWGGFGYDYNNTGQSFDLLTLSEIRDAIKSTLEEHGLSRLDMIIFEACLMSSVEVVYELHDLAHILIASENVMLRDGLAYAIRHAIEDLAGRTFSLVEFAEKIMFYYQQIMNSSNINKIYTAWDNVAKEYNGILTHLYEHNIITDIAEIENALNRIPTLSILDLTSASDFFEEWSNLVNYIRTHLEKNDIIILRVEQAGRWIIVEYANMKWIMMTALQSTELIFAYREYKLFQVDLYDFVKEMAELYETGDKQLFLDVLEAFERMIIDEWHCPRFSDAYGVNIYFPNSTDFLDDSGAYESTLFNVDFEWLTIIQLYFSTDPIHGVIKIPIY